MAPESGVPLSQLLQNHVDPILTGILSLDSRTNGLQNGCIYEIYGPPGVGKTKLGAQIVHENTSSGIADRRALWIDTFQQAPLTKLSKSNCSFTRVTKFTQLWYYFQRLDTRFDLVVVHGLSQLLSDYINISETTCQLKQTHEFKIKCLIKLMVVMTKYATKNNAVILLLNDAMNTAYQDYSDESIVSYIEHDSKNVKSLAASSSSFLVKSQKKRHVQVLKSALVANSAVGGKDYRWEVFLKGRIGMFWNWDPIKQAKIPSLLRKIVVQIQGSHDSEAISLLLSSDDMEKFQDYANNELLEDEEIQPEFTSISIPMSLPISAKDIILPQMNGSMHFTGDSPRNIIHTSISSIPSHKRQRLMTPEISALPAIGQAEQNDFRVHSYTPMHAISSSSRTNGASQLILTPRIAFSDDLSTSAYYSQNYQEEDTVEDTNGFVSDVVYDSEG